MKGVEAMPSTSAARKASLRWATVGIAAVVLLVAGWWSGHARADHTPEGFVHVCAVSGGAVRLADDCGAQADEFVLVTQEALQEVDERIATLEATVATQAEAIEGLQDLVAELTTANTTLTGQVATLEELVDGVTRLEVDGRDTLRFSGMNVQVVSGSGATDGDPNGLGNLIIGYSAPRSDTTPEDRSGSHYLIVGDLHHWTHFGGMVNGWRNASHGFWSSVTGGTDNLAAGLFSTVSGGFANQALGNNDTVSGGRRNTADGLGASVAGGSDNESSGISTTVAGGSDNLSRGTGSTITGGTDNHAIGISTSITGGQRNDVSGVRTSVHGGRDNVASGIGNSILGGVSSDVDGINLCHPEC